MYEFTLIKILVRMCVLDIPESPFVANEANQMKNNRKVEIR